jgi:predicted RNA-binding Zn-ribbon protein involved in translation (DUF1610 family)
LKSRFFINGRGAGTTGNGMVHVASVVMPFPVSKTARGRTMDSTFFSRTLGLHSPWVITAIRFCDPDQVQIDVDFSQIGFTCPACGNRAAVNRVSCETWEHLDYFSFKAHLHARIPLVECSNGCGISKLPAPWTRPGSLFSLIENAPSPAVNDFTG